MSNVRPGGFSDEYSSDDDFDYANGCEAPPVEDDLWIPRRHLNRNATEFEDNDAAGNQYSEPKSSRASSKYYCHPLPDDAVYMISCDAGAKFFISFLMDETKDRTTSGFDVEWAPFKNETTANLLQIAFKSSVFLVDIVFFANNPDSEIFSVLMKNYFCHENVVKVSYGVHNDLLQLAAVHPTWKDIAQESKSIVDLHMVEQRILETCPDFLPVDSIPKDVVCRGLGKLAFMTVGKHLNKNEQMSNWQQRPLTTSQIQYAASDAYVLLDIYDYMQHRANVKKIDLNDVISKITTSTSKKRSKNKSKKKGTALLGDGPRSITSFNMENWDWN